ncbi:MAG: CoA ester lyase [Rhizobiales bacterium]|nr:CoA ester lyase [Hyphomicrobiales bacterium]
MRSLLFVPADSERKLAKALSSGPDALILDLEDSVATARKAEARTIAAEWLAGAGTGCEGTCLLVRINALDTPFWQGDLDRFVRLGAGGGGRGAIEGIMVPKVRAAADLGLLSDTLATLERERGLEIGTTRLLALVTETPGAVLAMPGFTDLPDRVSGLTWGAEDLSAAVGATTARKPDGTWTSPFQLARDLTLFAAAAAGRPAYDTVFTQYRDEAGLQREAEEAARDGFSGKLAIHPAQVPIINAAFTPSRGVIEQSRRIVEAFQAVDNLGVASLDGEMIDVPHLRRAERILERARLAGLGD